MNQHLSEIISEVLEPVVDAYKGGNEVISSEDMVARVVDLNSGLTGPGWWEGKETKDGMYEACSSCVGRQC